MEKGERKMAKGDLFSTVLRGFHKEQVSQYLNDLIRKYEREKEELNQKFESIKCCSTTFHTEPSFVVKNSKEIPDLTVDLVQKYPGSYIYQEFMSDRRTGNGSIYIDHDEENMNFIVILLRFCDGT